MFYGQCWKCGERWEFGTASTCTCEPEQSQRPWVGLPMDEFKFIASKYLLSREVGLEYFQEEIEAKLKELNT